MPLGSAEIEQIGTYVRANLAEWMEDIVGPRLLGRAARVEDELTFQRELICTRFEAVDKRFEEMLHRFDTVDKRFEDIHHRFDAVDKRFEDMHRSMETRFQAVDKRFEDLHRSMDKRFEAVDTRFEGMQRNMETRFEDLHRNMDKRFEAVDKRFEDMHKRFNGMQWMVGGGVVLLATMMSLFRFFG